MTYNRWGAQTVFIIFFLLDETCLSLRTVITALSWNSRYLIQCKLMTSSGRACHMGDHGMLHNCCMLAVEAIRHRYDISPIGSIFSLPLDRTTTEWTVGKSASKVFEISPRDGTDRFPSILEI